MKYAKCKMDRSAAPDGDMNAQPEGTRRDFDALEDRLLEFGARVGKVVDALPDTRLGRHVAGQLVRCGTCGAPHYAEARAAESRADFIHKMGVALKELRETNVWLKFSIRSELLPEPRLTPLCEESSQLINIFAKSIVTAKENNPKRPPRRSDPPTT
jgi:four helix bundle protein